jgi:pSer/pThr/pTyr-binding forkhead associated (FHA) protein
MLPPGHLATVPLLDAQSPAQGHARLQYRGCDHPFRAKVFTLGRDPRCDLSFESSEFPSISGQHCKIVFEPPGFTLYDLSRHGTLVNDRPVIEQLRLQPGDWIRLGPNGPLLRFLGQVLDQRKLLPTA